MEVYMQISNLFNPDSYARTALYVCIEQSNNVNEPLSSVWNMGFAATDTEPNACDWEIKEI